MKQNYHDRVMKLTAKTKAYDWYCRFHELADPDLSSGLVDQRVVHQHSQAWAWAERTWEEFVGQIDDEDSRFLMQLIAEGTSSGAGKDQAAKGRSTQGHPRRSGRRW